MRDTVVATEVIRGAVRLASRAPSLHNSQPWRWILDGSTVELHLDKTRILHGTDHTGRQALIGCGAILDHFRVAMAAAGWLANVDVYPNPNDSRHLASIDFTPMRFVTDGHRRRADAILRRRTDRLPFGQPRQWVSVEPRLRGAVTSDVVRCDVIADELRPELAEASQLAQSLRLYDSTYHSEMNWWTGPYETREGVPHNALVSAAESDRVDVGRVFPVTHHSERRLSFGEDQSKVLVLSTLDNERSSVLRCGEMLSAVLLEATMADLATCTLTHITELRAGRTLVASLIERDATPQVLVRVGSVTALEELPPPTPRRPIDDIFHVRRTTPFE